MGLCSPEMALLKSFYGERARSELNKRRSIMLFWGHYHLDNMAKKVFANKKTDFKEREKTFNKRHRKTRERKKIEIRKKYYWSEEEILLFANGFTNAEIALRTGRSRSAVATARRRFKTRKI